MRSLNARGQHWVPILDGGIAVAKDYPIYTDAVAANILIKDLTGKRDYNGQIWPGRTVFPSYINNNRTSAWVLKHVRRFYEAVTFSGLWLDMNEVRGVLLRAWGACCDLRHT